MRENLTDIRIIVDASGSMIPLTQETIDNLNEFIQEQRAEPGYLNLTIYSFNSRLRTLLPTTDIREVKKITTKDYKPTGMTALLDAMGTVIYNTGVELKNTPEKDRPAKVLILTITDGKENRSTQYSQQQVADMIQHQQDKYNWSFSFLGANIDTFDVAGKLNIDLAASSNYDATKEGLKGIYSATIDSVKGWRGSSVNARYKISK